MNKIKSFLIKAKNVLLTILMNWIVIFIAGSFYNFVLLPYVFKKPSPLFTNFLWTVFWMGILTFLVRNLISLIIKEIKK